RGTALATSGLATDPYESHGGAFSVLIEAGTVHATADICCACDPSEQPTGDYPTVPASQPRVRVEFGALTHQGRVRENNEDHFLIARLAKSMRIAKTSLPGDEGMRFSDEEGCLMIVADGMGGAAAGEEASSVAVETVESFVLNTLKWFLHLGH